MNTTRSVCATACAVLVVALTSLQAEPLTKLEQLGKELFFDANLSTPTGQSCAACHAPEVGFTGPDSAINAGPAVFPGAVHSRAGNRKPPTAAYAGDSPVLYFDEVEGLWIGGMFWDGRATGQILGDPLAEQAMAPFLNNLEMNMSGAKQVVDRVAASSYAPLFYEVWGQGTLNSTDDLAGSYERIARSIAAYERSSEVNPFTSKYDYYLKGKAKLTKIERDGLKLFNGKAQCALCHLSDGDKPLFTDFTYDNLGVPKNPLNPFYEAPTSVNPAGSDWVDAGLAGFLASAGKPEDVWMPELGKQKVPTLRNVDRRPYPGFVKSFTHNGFFKSLEEVVHFYNTRDVQPWPAPEVPETVNTDELGNLKLSAAEEAAVVAFMKTLTDGYQP